jgi:hypothetical protein
LKRTYNTRLEKRQIDNEEIAQLEDQHRKELESIRKEVAKLTSLLEQVLGSISGEAKFIAQPEPLLVNPQNLGENKGSFESQSVTYSQIAQP